jgi:hypothetical protein
LRGEIFRTIFRRSCSVASHCGNKRQPNIRYFRGFAALLAESLWLSVRAETILGCASSAEPHGIYLIGKAKPFRKDWGKAAPKK